MKELFFDETTHTYTLDDGRKLISVTQAISILDGRWKVDPFYLERGRIIHLATQYYDRNELDDSTIDPQVQPYLDSYIKFQMDTLFIPYPQYIEYRLFHPQFVYAGTIDRIGQLNGNECLIDIKSGQKARIDELQGAAYWELCRANNIPIKKIFDLYLHDNGTYKLEPIEKPKLLLPVFLACLQIIRWKENL